MSSLDAIESTTKHMLCKTYGWTEQECLDTSESFVEDAFSILSEQAKVRQEELNKAKNKK